MLPKHDLAVLNFLKEKKDMRSPYEIAVGLGIKQKAVEKSCINLMRRGYIVRCSAYYKYKELSW